MTTPPSGFVESLSRTARIHIKGPFYRVVPQSAVLYGLEDGPSYRFNNRYNLAGQFGALYFADREEVCKAILEKRGHLASRMLPHSLLTFDVDVNQILDLTDLKSLSALKIHVEDLLKQADMPDAYDIPHQLSTAVYNEGRVCGLFVPDATRTGNTLVLYPARLLSKDYLRLKSTQMLN